MTFVVFVAKLFTNLFLWNNSSIIWGRGIRKYGKAPLPWGSNDILWILRSNRCERKNEGKYTNNNHTHTNLSLFSYPLLRLCSPLSLCPPLLPSSSLFLPTYTKLDFGGTKLEKQRSRARGLGGLLCKDRPQGQDQENPQHGKGGGRGGRLEGEEGKKENWSSGPVLLILTFLFLRSDYRSSHPPDPQLRLVRSWRNPRSR